MNTNILTPFAISPLTKNFSILADLFHASPQILVIEYKISGPLELIVWPSAEDLHQTRQDLLWQHTCLEAFFSCESENQSPYIEVNCSPAGMWNAYAFSNYRDGMHPCQNTTVRLKERESSLQEARFQVEVLSTKPLKISSYNLTVVIEFKSGEKSYWALSHPPDRADFHDKKAWHHQTND